MSRIPVTIPHNNGIIINKKPTINNPDNKVAINTTATKTNCQIPSFVFPATKLPNPGTKMLRTSATIANPILPLKIAVVFRLVETGALFFLAIFFAIFTSFY